MQSWILDVFNLLQHSKNKYFNSEIYDDAYLMAQKLEGYVYLAMGPWNSKIDNS
jgi:hypothetical protein